MMVIDILPEPLEKVLKVLTKVLTFAGIWTSWLMIGNFNSNYSHNRILPCLSVLFLIQDTCIL